MNLSNLLTKRAGGFLSSGLAKRLAAALLIGFTLVVGFSTLLPVRGVNVFLFHPDSSRTSQATVPANNDTDFHLISILHNMTSFHRCAVAAGTPALPPIEPDIPHHNLPHLFHPIPLPSFIVKIPSICNMAGSPTDAYVSAPSLCHTRRTTRRMEERSWQRLGACRLRCMEPTDLRAGYPKS